MLYQYEELHLESLCMIYCACFLFYTKDVERFLYALINCSLFVQRTVVLMFFFFIYMIYLLIKGQMFVCTLTFH